jgi:hypothetical protein
LSVTDKKALQAQLVIQAAIIQFYRSRRAHASGLTAGGILSKIGIKEPLKNNPFSRDYMLRR